MISTNTRKNHQKNKKTTHENNLLLSIFLAQPTTQEQQQTTIIIKSEHNIIISISNFLFFNILSYFYKRYLISFSRLIRSHHKKGRWVVVLTKRVIEVHVHTYISIQKQHFTLHYFNVVYPFPFITSFLLIKAKKITQ